MGGTDAAEPVTLIRGFLADPARFLHIFSPTTFTVADWSKEASLLKVSGLLHQRFKTIPRHVLRVVQVNGANSIALQPVVDSS